VFPVLDEIRVFLDPGGTFIFLYIFDWSQAPGAACFQHDKSIDSELNCTFCQMGYRMRGWRASEGGKRLDRVE